MDYTQKIVRFVRFYGIKNIKSYETSKCKYFIYVADNGQKQLYYYDKQTKNFYFKTAKKQEKLSWLWAFNLLG